MYLSMFETTKLQFFFLDVISISSPKKSCEIISDFALFFFLTGTKLKLTMPYSTDTNLI